jgi:hypothetical protein
MERRGTALVLAWRVVVLLLVATAAPSAGFTECIEQCVATPAAAGHFECCTNPLVSSFNKPSCASGCHMAEVRVCGSYV